MKGLFAILILLLVAIGVGVWWTQRQATEFPTEYIALAFGEPGEGSIRMDVLVPVAMPRREGPRIDPETGAVYWQEWVDEHFDLRDEQNAKVPLTRVNHSRLISGKEARTTPEFFVTGTLKPQTRYLFDYVPFRIGTLRYRYEFTAPAAAQRTERWCFRRADL